jgi:hypothetical protein
MAVGTMSPGGYPEPIFGAFFVWAKGGHQLAFFQPLEERRKHPIGMYMG